ETLQQTERSFHECYLQVSRLVLHRRQVGQAPQASGVITEEAQREAGIPEQDDAGADAEDRRVGEVGQFLSRLHIPPAQPAVVAANLEERAPVRGPLDNPSPAREPAIFQASYFLAAANVPHAHGVVVAGRQDALAVRRKDEHGFTYLARGLVAREASNL